MPHVDPRATAASSRRGTSRVVADVGDPFWLIVGVLAIATVLLWPIRAWMASRRNRDTADEGETPLAPPERRNRG